MMRDLHYRILHLEDLPSDALLAEREIKKILKNYSLHIVETEADFIKELEEFKPHIVISDFQLPSFNGLSALKIVLHKTPLTPVIILTGSMNEDTAVDCMKAGAADYVIKEHLKRLGPSVLNTLEQKEIKIEKIKAEKQILLLSKSIEQSPVCVVITNPTGEIEYVNKTFAKLTGYSSDEAIGKKPSILRSGKQSKEFYEKMWQTILTGVTWKGEMHNKRKNGELYWESVSISSIVNEEGAIEHFIGIKENITEKKQILEELVAAKERAEENDRLKTAFLHNISHEIRTPLNGITGFSDIISSPDLSPEKKKHYAQIIRESSDQLISIVDDIISMATIEAGQEMLQESETDINTLLELLKNQNVQKTEAKNLSLTVVSALNDEEKMVLTDKTKLQQILTNLLSNAIKFTIEGHIKVNCMLNGNFIKFTVEDTGIGIPFEMHENIFDRFFQIDSSDIRPYGGNGLGLSIVKSYVHFLQGEISLNSTHGGGSVFSISIPYNPVKQPKPINIPAHDFLKQIGHVTILITEDEEINYFLLEVLLSDMNINLIRAINGLEAIEICKNNNTIDLILMDLRMPVIDGFEATRQIREFRPELPIIAQTAYSTNNDKNKALACGCNDFICKPFKQELLLSMIKEQLLK